MISSEITYKGKLLSKGLNDIYNCIFDHLRQDESITVFDGYSLARVDDAPEWTYQSEKKVLEEITSVLNCCMYDIYIAFNLKTSMFVVDYDENLQKVSNLNDWKERIEKENSSNSKMTEIWNNFEMNNENLILIHSDTHEEIFISNCKNDITQKYLECYHEDLLEHEYDSD